MHAQGTVPSKDAFVCIASMFLGMSMLAPFNTLVTSMQYFRDAFEPASGLFTSFSSGVMSVFNATSLVCAVIATMQGNRPHASPIRRILYSLYATLIVFFILACSIFLRGKVPVHHAVLYYVFLLACSMILAISTTYMQSAIMVLCTHLSTDGKIVGYALMGQALQGLLGSVINFFSTAAMVNTRGVSTDEPGTYVIENERAALVVFISAFALQIATLLLFRRMATIPSVEERIKHWIDTDLPSHAAALEGTDKRAMHKLIQVQKKIIPWSISMVSIFVVTLGVYPSLTTMVQPQMPAGNTLLQNSNVFIALHIVMLNVGDLLGRRIPLLSSKLLVRDGFVSLAGAASRIVFIPMFLCCNIVHANGTPKHKHPFSDEIFFLLTLLLGATMGAISTSIFVSGPRTSTRYAHVSLESTELLGERDTSGEEDASIASLLLSFWLIVGLTLGSCFSFLIVKFA